MTIDLANPLTYLVGLAILSGLAAIFIWVGKVDSDRASFNEFMKEVKDELKSIREHVAQIFQRLPEPAATAASPLELTDFGHAISGVAGAKQIARRLSEQLREEVAGKADFEIQAFCENYIKTE